MATKKLDSNSKRLSFHYRKSSLFRVIKIDGVWGGVAPRQEIQMSVFNERLPLPEMEEVELPDDRDGVAKSLRVVKKTQGIVREVEATIVMGAPIARAVGEWLIAQADIIEELVKAGTEESDITAK